MKNKLITATILFFTFIFLTFVYVYSRSNITVLQYPLQNSAIKHKVFDEFTKGKKINGEFAPNENYLGQVLIRFYNYQRINKDEVTFRIKEKNQNSWYYEHTYKTDQFFPDYLFTFGFPIIPDSKGKTYDFEIESVNGTPNESITLSKISPLAAVTFQYPKALLVKNPSLASVFILHKIKYMEVNRDLFFSFLIYLNFISIVMLLEYVFIRKMIEYKFKDALNGQNLIVIGLLVMLASMLLLYLKKPVISLQVTSVAYFLLVAGVMWCLFARKIKDK